MLDNEPEGGEQTGVEPGSDTAENPTPARRTRATRRRQTAESAAESETPAASADADGGEAPVVASESAEPKTRRRRKAAEPVQEGAPEPAAETAPPGEMVPESPAPERPPAPVKATRSRRRKVEAPPEPALAEQAVPEQAEPEGAATVVEEAEPEGEAAAEVAAAAEPVAAVVDEVAAVPAAESGLEPAEQAVPEQVEPEGEAAAEAEAEAEAAEDAVEETSEEPAEETGEVAPGAAVPAVRPVAAAPLFSPVEPAALTDVTTTPAVPPPVENPTGTAPTAAIGEPGGLTEEQPTTRPRRSVVTPPTVLFMAPDPVPSPRWRTAERDVPAPEAAGDALVDDPETVAVDGPGAGEQVESARRRRRSRRGAEPVETAAEAAAEEVAAEAAAEAVAEEEEEEAEEPTGRRRRRRGRRGRGRGKGSTEEVEEATTAEPAEAVTEEQVEADEPATTDESAEAAEAGEEAQPTRRRRRRRRRGGEPDTTVEDDGIPTVVKIREPRRTTDEVQGVSGSTRLEAKRQRRRDGREQRRTRPPILTEAEFLARREAVDRVMVVRQRGDRTQIAVLEDGVLVEHYVTRASSSTMAGNVYLGKVQNVLPSMEAAFVDIGRGRNAVLYAGEVNWDATGLEGRARSIEQALHSGDSVLVQVTKDPIGHKGARLTSHIALSGRHLVYVPNGNASGISRKLPDNERKRLREILKKLVPDGAGVIVRTAAEGATEDELARDIKRLQAQWEDIQAKAAQGGAPVLLYEEPDLVIRVVRDLFNEDFRELVIQGDEAYAMVESYLGHVSPDLLPRLRRHVGVEDVFAEHRIDEQILKALDRKVYLPSGGHLVIDRTEAMTVIDVNTGKYTGAGGNLEETVTRNNLEAAEEIVRQLRLRDLGGIVVIDFIDMVLEANRELVLRRLTECLGRDRTKHQVTEITSLGLVQMTRKRIGTGLLEAFSETCECCKGRGVIIHLEPPSEKPKASAGEKVKAVASASSTSAASGTSGSARRRARKAAAEPAPAAVNNAAEPAPVNNAAESAPTPVNTAVVAEDDETMGYDLSRYEVGEPAAPGNGSAPVEPTRLAGPGDPDLAVESDGSADSLDAEPVEAGAGGRRRSRRDGARRADS